MPSWNGLATWREQVGRRLLNLDFRAEGDQPFYFDLRPLVVTEGVRVVANRHSPGVTVRDADLIKDGDDSLAFVYPKKGRMHFSQRCELTLNANEPLLIDTTVPGALGARTVCSFISVIFPPGALPAKIDRARLEKERWPKDAPALRLLRAYVDTLAGSNIPPFSDLADAAHRHILDLVRLAATERSERDPRDVLASGTISEARVRIALGDIEKNFRDPLLSETDVARRQGITPRHLQRLFEQAGLRFTTCVNELRLETASRALTSPQFNGQSVMEIALDAGFTDVSHFNRVFKRRYGATPSEVRAGRGL